MTHEGTIERRRQSRQERRRDADDDEHERRGDAELLRERGHGDDGDDPDDSDQRDLHGPTLQADSRPGSDQATDQYQPVLCEWSQAPHGVP